MLLFKLQDLKNRVRHSITATLRLIDDNLSDMYENEERYALAISAYALHIAAALPDATDDLQEIKDQAFEYLERRSVDAGTLLYVYTSNSVNVLFIGRHKGLIQHRINFL